MRTDNLDSFYSIAIIASGKSSGWQPVSAQYKGILITASWPTQVCSDVGVQRQRCLCVRLILPSSVNPVFAHTSCMVGKMIYKWLHNGCFAGCCFHNLFRTIRSFVVFATSFLLCKRLVRDQMVHCTVVWTRQQLERIPVLIYQRSDVYLFIQLSIAVHILPRRMLTSLSLDDIFLLSYIK